MSDHGSPGSRAARPPTSSRPLQRDSGLPPLPSRILHLDVDAFLASVEQALHPELRGRPVVVGGLPTDRNLVMSCSYEARAFGVRPGMALAEAARRAPGAIFRRGSSADANRLRERTASVLLEFTPEVEIASIDDFFLDLTGTERLHGPAFAVAERMRAEVQRRLSLPLTIGIGTSRMLARLAGKLAKPGGVAEIWPGHEQSFLDALPIEHLPGVGSAIGTALERFAIRTVGELRLVPREILFATFGRDGLVIHERAHGVDRGRVEANCYEDERGELRLRPPKSIRRDSTFEPEEGRREIVEAMLCYLVERSAGRLRAFGLCTRSLEVRLRYVDTRPRAERVASEEALSHAARRSFSLATDSTDELWQAARELLRGFPRRRALVKRVGLTLATLAPSAGWQGRLFSDPALDRAPAGRGPAGSHADRQRRLDAALDALRRKQGFGRLLRGGSWPVRETHALTPEGFRLRTPSLNQ